MGRNKSQLDKRVLYGGNCIPWHNPEDNPTTGCWGEPLFLIFTFLYRI